MRTQINNGYDAFAIDNSRTTESDNPGVDRQYSTGISARSTYTGLGSATLTTIATYADTKVNYGFDGDWGNPVLWAPYTDDATEDQVRHRSTRSLEFRLGDTPTNESPHGLSWLVGVYAFELRESLTDTSAAVYIDPFDATQNSDSLTVVSSEYRSRNGAIYGQLDGDLGDRARWSVGVRGERHTSRYNDTTTNLDAPTTANDFGPADNLWGGQASIDYRIADGQNVYALIARGYKASGFNLSPGLPANQLLFGPESDLNLEIGHKARVLDGRLQIDTSLFYMIRHNEQLITGEQLDPSNPNTFIFYTGNAKSGFNYGLESTASWAATQSWVVRRFSWAAADPVPRFCAKRRDLSRSRLAACASLAGRAQRDVARPARTLCAPGRHRHGTFFLRFAAELDALERLWTGQRQAGLGDAALGSVFLGAQPARQELHRARLLLRRRAAGFPQ